MARPKKDDAKKQRVEVRMNEAELQTLEKCTAELQTSKSEVLLIGLKLVDSMLSEKEK